MTISGIGATPEQPESRLASSIDAQPQHSGSIWASVDYTTDNKVNVSDITFKNVPEELSGIRDMFKAKLSEFLKTFEDSNQDWTDEIKDKINTVIDLYNTKCNEQLDKFRQLEQSTKLEGINVYNEAFDTMQAMAISEVDDFENNANKELDNLNKEGVYQILDDLEKDGYTGYVNIEGVGLITYDHNAKEFTIKYQDNTDKYLSKDEIKILIEQAIDKGTMPTGASNMTANY